MTDLIDFLKKVDNDEVEVDNLTEEAPATVISECLDDNNPYIQATTEETFRLTAEGKSILREERNQEAQEESLRWQKITASLTIGKAVIAIISFGIGLFTGGAIL